MIGYLNNNKDFFKGRAYEYNLKKAVAYSGGNQRQYNFFDTLLKNSIINRTTGRPLHDARAGEFLLHLFPLKVQILLSVLFYQYEINLIKEFDEFSLDSNNILLPSQQIQYNSIITGNSIAESFLIALDDAAVLNSSMNDQSLSQIKRIFNIPFTINDLNLTLIENVELLLSKFRVPTISKSQFITIVKQNSKLDSAIITARSLNYKPQSIQYLTEATSLWRQNLNT